MTVLRETPHQYICHFDVELLIKEARRRQRRRKRVTAVASTFIVLVGVLIATVAGGGGSHRSARSITSGKSRPSKAVTAKPPQTVKTENYASLIPQYSYAGAADASVGYAIGQGGLHFTYDAGLTWITRSMPANTPGNSGYDPTVAAFGTNDLWMTMEALRVASINSATDFGSNLAMAIDHSTDGGATWSLNYLPCSEICNETGMSFVNSSQGYIVGTDPSGIAKDVLYRTVDGGASWSLVSTPPLMSDIEFVTPTVGWSVSGPAPISISTTQTVEGLNLYRTIDGGKTWTTVKIPRPKGYSSATDAFGAPEFFNGNVGVVPAEFNVFIAKYPYAPVVVIYKTVNGGKTWKALFTPSDPRSLTESEIIGGAPSFNIAFSAPSPIAWVIAGGTKLYATSNGAHTWKTNRQPSVIRQSLTIDFASATRGWVLNDNIYQTTNAGEKWALTNP